MKLNKKNVTIVALSAILGCSVLSGCDFVTSDSDKDLKQVLAEVNITESDAFAESGYEQYESVIQTSEVLKRDMVASYVSVGYTYVESYGYTYEATFDLILDSLVNRQIYMQYAIVYLLDSNEGYTVSGYNSAVSGEFEDDLAKQIAGFGYFLDDEEIALATYTVKETINSTIDSLETSIINEDDDTEYDDARTTPTGVDEEEEDYYDEAYEIYTGYNSAANCGSYETVDGSTPVTRRKAYGQFLASLNAYALIESGENTTDPTSLSYYRLEIRGAYEDALIDKLSDLFEEEAEAQVTKEWVEDKYKSTLASQKDIFDDDSDSFETALDSLSDSSFVLYSPSAGYGFVINILLPFSTTQSTALETALADYGDKQGNYFNERAKLLKNISATDQRTTWFTCEDDYSFDYTDYSAALTNVYTAGDSNRTYLFFENNLTNNDKYQSIPNYYGKYTFNGKVSTDDDGDYVITANKLSVDDFITEMNAYIGSTGEYKVTSSYEIATGETSYNPTYYSKSVSDYYKADGTVDYSQFIYYTASVSTASGTALSDLFSADDVFVDGSDVNTVMSMVNELSFAYNTDTAGLNTYLGYAISPNETDYVKEFEYAAQLAVSEGVGTIVVVCSDYGWHILYCTFSYSAAGEVYSFDWDDIENEGTFSNLYYEALKSSTLETYATDKQTQIINAYNVEESVTTYKNRYKDLYQELDADD